MYIWYQNVQNNREQISRLTMVYKMYHGLVAIDTSQLLVHPEGIAASAHPHHFIRPAWSNELQRNSFFHRSLRQWNDLPADDALAPSLDMFKKRVCQVQHQLD